MMNAREKQQARERRIRRTRAKVVGSVERPRLTVRRSLTAMYAQIINDQTGKTLVAASDRDLSTEQKTGKKMDRSLAVGKLIAERAKAAGVVKVVFDRRDKKYHGRVKALAEGAREGGLEF